MNKCIVRSQVVTTYNYNTIADCLNKTSQFAFNSLYLVAAPHNGYSSAMFSLDVSW
jgi:hypothetical protein